MRFVRKSDAMKGTTRFVFEISFSEVAKIDSKHLRELDEKKTKAEKSQKLSDFLQYFAQLTELIEEKT